MSIEQKHYCLNCQWSGDKTQKRCGECNSKLIFKKDLFLLQTESYSPFHKMPQFIILAYLLTLFSWHKVTQLKDSEFLWLVLLLSGLLWAFLGSIVLVVYVFWMEANAYMSKKNQISIIWIKLIRAGLKYNQVLHWPNGSSPEITSWLQSWVSELPTESKVKTKRIHFSSAFRARVWFRKFSTQLVAKCPVCLREEISPFRFHVGHIISLAEGGNNLAENCQPVCDVCNRAMGKQNLFDFAASLKT